MKNIIVQEYEFGKIPREQIAKIHHATQSWLPEDYILITTPLKTYMANPDDKLIYIQAKSYSSNELLELIEKAEMYNGLCK